MNRLQQRRDIWIEKARDAHGNKYDYSLVEFQAARRFDVVIICPTHGEFRQSTETHLRRRRRGDGFMGCRKCGDDERRKEKRCKKCGVLMPTGRGQTRVICDKCRESKKTPKCKGCGKDRSADRAYCSVECWKKNQSPPEVKRLTCSKCGKQFDRWACSIKSTEMFCCSLKCQREHAFIDNRGPGGGQLSDFKRSLRAKKRWKRFNRKQRKQRSVGYRWWRLCQNRRQEGKQINPWKRRCNSAAGLLTQRIKLIEYAETKKNNRSIQTWKQATETASPNLRNRSSRARRLSCSWKRKCGSVAANSQKRSAKKSTEEARQRIWAYYKCKGSSVDAIRLLGLSGGPKTFQKRIAEIAKAIGAESARDLFTRSQKDSSRVTSEYLMRLARLQDYKCALSGVPITPSTAELDHIVPFSKGGKNTKQNVQWVHRVINRMKGQMGQDEFKQWCRMVAR